MIRALWENHRALTVAGAAALAAAVGVAGYLLLKRPGDVSNPGAFFEAEEPVSNKQRFGDWPMYGLNPERTRYLPAKGLEPPYQVKWSFKGRALLEYSPVLFKDTLFLVNNNGTFFAIDANKGKKRYQIDLARLNASAPAFDRGRLYIANLDPGQITAIHHKTGKILWQKRLPGRTESSPAVAKGKVIVGCECGSLFAFDGETGEMVWETELGGAVKAAPAVSEGVAYVGDYGGQFSAVRVKDGSIKWQSGSQGAGFGRTGRIYATAAVGFGRVYVGSLDSRMYSFEKETGELAWSQSTGDWVYAAPVLASTPSSPPTVYFGSYDGTFYALDARSGDVRWQKDIGGQISGAGSLIGETVYVAELRGTSTIGFRANDGEQAFEFHDGAYNPVISDGKRIFLTGRNRLYALKPARGPAAKKKAVSGELRGKKRKGK